MRRTAPFEALYPMWILSWPTNPEIDEMLTMAPPPAWRMAGPACFIPRKTPLAFTSMRVPQAAELSVSGSNVPLMPALLTRTWSLPKPPTVGAMAPRQSASRVTSSFTKHACAPVLAMSAATWDPSASRRSPTTTFAPSLAKIVASLRPMPLAPPVMSATFPASLMRAAAPHPARPGGALPVLGGDLAASIEVGAAHGLHVGAEDRLAVRPRPLVRRLDGREGALEARHDVPGEELVAPQRLLAVGPLVGPKEEAAEAALAELLEPLDAANNGLGRADQRGAHAHALAQGVVGTAGWAAEGLLEVGDGLVPFGALDFAERPLVILCDVDVDHDAPVLSVHALAVPPGGLLGDLPLLGQRVGPAGQSCADREHAEAVLARRHHAEGCDGAGHRDGEVRLGVRRQVQPRLAQLEPVGLHRHRLLAPQAPHEGLQRLLHARTLGHGLDAHHIGVGHERPRAAAEHGAAARHVVEQDEAGGHHQRVVVGQARHARAQHDVARALGGCGDEDLGRSDRLPSGPGVLADPHLVVAEMVEPLDELHVARQGEGGVLADPVERGEEDAELHARVSHGVSVGTVVRRIVARTGGRG